MGTVRDLSAATFDEGHRMGKQTSSRIRSPQQALELMARLLAEEDPEREERFRWAGLLASEDEAPAVVRLTPTADALVGELADEAHAAREQITRPRRSDGIVHALQRLEAEKPPELAAGSLKGWPGGESPAAQTVKRSVPLWVKRRLEELRPAATAAWGRAPRGSFGGGPKARASDSMTVQYAIERQRAGERH
jgi:hypothetical protein